MCCSERLDRSKVEGARKTEACAINQSLSALGDVFEALSARSKHVPYRNSKLTYLLKVPLLAHSSFDHPKCQNLKVDATAVQVHGTDHYTLGV